MTDRELLELAARAAGITGEWVEGYKGDFYYQGNTDGILYELPNGEWVVWNPLVDDGDALRLTVTLGISISFSHRTGLDLEYPAILEVGAFAGWSPTFTEVNRCEWPAATRRAIVRAAADIGRTMP